MNTNIVLDIVFFKIGANGAFIKKSLIHRFNAKVLYASCNRNLALKGRKK